jgi:SAM-dependent methyltransferase
MPDVASALQHYDTILAPHYSAMFGDFEARVAAEQALLERLGVRAGGGRPALDLGSGPGFRSLALARLGFRVRAVDFCRPLLDELAGRRGAWPIELVPGDIRAVRDLAAGPAALAVCMGDTLTHLASRREVEDFLAAVFSVLEPGGRLVLTFRDLTRELRDLERFILLAGSDDRILTCFLEYEAEAVRVHDLIHVRREGRWHLDKGCYRKLRLSPARVTASLRATGFVVDREEATPSGLVALVACRPDASSPDGDGGGSDLSGARS